jgi:hypothetical protein
VSEQRGYQSYRPTAYLDQWVWIRLARAAAGKPDAPEDPDLLEALVDAADAGVAFPLSWTHYIETQSIKNRRQRKDVAGVMASISHFRGLRSRTDLMRNQLLIATHDEFGRPTFRPENLDPLGVGVHWVFDGVEKTLQIHDVDGNVVDSDLFTREMRVRGTQGFEYALMAGPRQEEEAVLRERYGYKPEATEEEGLRRLEREQEFVGLLQDTPPEDPAELRVWIQAREVTHEHLELLTDVFKEHGLSTRVLDGGFGEDRPQGRREFISGFFDRMPSVQVAVDLKLAVRRNNQRGWAQNDVYDTDAMSIAVPYCAVVVADKAVADALGRVKASERHGTLVTPKLDELAEVLPQMVKDARDLPDPSGWEALCPGVGFNPATPERLAAELTSVRLNRAEIRA